MKKGSITVEASLVLPIFLFFLLGFFYFFNMLSLQDLVQKALTDTANELSLRAYFEEKESSEAETYLLFAKNIGRNYFGESCISKGMISLRGSYYEKEEIILSADYIIKIPVPFWNKKRLLVNQKVRTRKFLGRDRREENGGFEEENSDEIYVYIAENGRVYHTTDTCSHLKRSIEKIDISTVEKRRNHHGEKYKPCEICAKGKWEEKETICYITREGDRYHKLSSCPGLKRTIKKVPLEQVIGWNACKRCKKKEK
ncbi:MAG: TadE/TadG family type IV pilus assembly protein [Acetivibrio sp.]